MGAIRNASNADSEGAREDTVDRPMRVQLLNIYFGRETIGTGIVAFQLAEALADAGHSVDVITTNADYGTLVPRTVREETCGGGRIRVCRIPCPFAIRPAILRRVLLYAAYLLASGPVALACRRPDVVVLVTPPSVAMVPGAFAAKLRRVPLVVDVEDLYAVSSLRASFAGKANASLERWLVRQSAGVRVLSDALKRQVDDWTGEAGRSRTIPVWADRKDIGPHSDGTGFRADNDLVGRFVVLHAGNVGSLGGQSCVIDAAERFRSDGDVRFVFLGGGYGVERLRAEAIRRNLDNVSFIERVSRQSLSEALAAADIGLATLDPRMGVGSTPSKVFAYMAAAKPIIAAVDDRNPAATAIRSGDCGWVVQPGCGESLAAAVAEARRLGSEGRRAAGQRGSLFASGSHDRERCLAAFVAMIEEVASGDRSGKGSQP